MVKVTEHSSKFSLADFDLTAWVERVAGKLSSADHLLLANAVELAFRAHAGQLRLSGEHYISHVLAVAEILSTLNADCDALCAAVLHDVVEDTPVTLKEITEQFGPAIGQLVAGVTKMRLLREYTVVDAHTKNEKHQAENLRKLLLAMVEDVRVVLIKLADRLHNMRTLGFLPPERQQRIAHETLDIFAPLANRLGIWQIKWELEDLALRYLEPDAYKSIAALLDERRLDRERYIASAIQIIESELQQIKIAAKVSGRPKHIYSIWKKMQRKHIGFHEVFDVRAVRILVHTVADCYAALGVVHTLWRHVPKEFDDYIATPKENDYQSLHTAVIGPDNKTLEIQIRTEDMHAHSELGVAAHWRYKEGGHYDSKYEAKLHWLRQILEWKEEEPSAKDFVARFKAEVFQDRVYVLTPKGNILDLVQGATPLDFAYSVHTDIGHRCRGAKVNGHIVPLTYELKTGEQVEILTARQGTPSLDWLNPQLGYLKTSRARAKVRAWFKQQHQGQSISDGRTIVDRELRRVGIGGVSLQKLATHFKQSSVDDFLVLVGNGELAPTHIVAAAQELLSPEPDDVPILRDAPERKFQATPGAVQVAGVGNLLTSMAKCCKPVPHDSIVGYITKGRGVTVHRRDCANVTRLNESERDRFVEVSWNKQAFGSFAVDIRVLAHDRRGLLKDITSILSNEEINVLAVNTLTDIKDQMARMHLTLEISDITQLSRILVKMNQLSGVLEVARK